MNNRDLLTLQSASRMQQRGLAWKAAAGFATKASDDSAKNVGSIVRSFNTIRRRIQTGGKLGVVPLSVLLARKLGLGNTK